MKPGHPRDGGLGRGVIESVGERLHNDPLTILAMTTEEKIDSGVDRLDCG
jgi:hypothetical protein